MSKLFQNIVFILGLLCGTVFYFWITITIDRRSRGIPCFDCQWETGFPFAYHQESGFVEPSRYLWFGLIADVIIAVIFSFIIGLIFRFIWSKISSHRTELK